MPKKHSNNVVSWEMRFVVDISGNTYEHEVWLYCLYINFKYATGYISYDKLLYMTITKDINFEMSYHVVGTL